MRSLGRGQFDSRSNAIAIALVPSVMNESVLGFVRGGMGQNSVQVPE